MRTIGVEKLAKFVKKHRAAKIPIASFQKSLEACAATNHVELLKTFGTADYVRPYYVFNVGGNNYRVIVLITFQAGVANIREVLTHAEYDQGGWKA